MPNWKKIAYACLGVLYTGCASLQDLTLTEIDQLTTCHISLSQAKRNLMAKGYGMISESEDQFTTDYRKSEFESWVTTLTQEPVVDTHRRMVVFSDGGNKVRFTFKYRRIEYPEKYARLGNPEFNAGEREDYRRIRREVCEPAALDRARSPATAPIQMAPITSNPQS
ncbi:MAG: hypothetical protein OXT67_10795 [Zetaproteobacteria bacterium]|nr:hypothetical protein [Zetaproteobacteria bacterium]